MWMHKKTKKAFCCFRLSNFNIFIVFFFVCFLIPGKKEKADDIDSNQSTSTREGMYSADTHTQASVVMFE